jgi:hypothetical protein
MVKKLLAVLIIGLSAGASVSQAQTPLRRYRPPAGPTMTPYLNYHRADFSTLPDPYNSFIVPQRQAQRQSYDLSRQDRARFQTLEKDLDQIKESTAPPTGVGGSFMNYSHYYPQATAGRQAVKGSGR